MSSIRLCEKTGDVTLTDPLTLPMSAGYLWNKSMMIHMNCRGYATAQFMQPEPTKYAKHPFLEAVSFMQPEQAYYASHPGRFFYIKDCDTNEFFSAPYEPARKPLDTFEFTARASSIHWHIKALGLQVDLSLRLAPHDSVELWSCEVSNLSDRKRNISIYSYFPFGYMSWMNQSATYSSELNAVIGSSVTPYQKVEFYEKNKHLKDKSFLMCDSPADAWDARQSAFEGEGGLHHPSGIQNISLSNSDSLYEVPTAAMQFNRSIEPGSSVPLNFAFGPAKDENEIAKLKENLIDGGPDLKDASDSANTTDDTNPLDFIQIETPDRSFDHYVNHWLSRQVFYHGDVNRLSTDPQTRNYLQDNMGMGYLKPDVTRQAFVTALSQQQHDGSMPDGIVLIPGGELKYINKIPHTDHCVWLPICLQAYLDETNDYDFLNQKLGFADSDKSETVFEHLNMAMQWLLQNRDERGLAYIAQGDWCDPMNMVGHKGKGVSGWLTVAISYALKCWATICEDAGKQAESEKFASMAREVSADANTHLWDGNWYARGITDDNVKFGVSTDVEGRIFLNPQSWALLSDTADKEQQQKLIAAVDEQLNTPYGPVMLAPAYTQMRDDVGRLTQKFPGNGENGSVYNHASAFYIYALYGKGDADRAYDTLRKMIPGPSEEDYLQRGQLPVFIPNYYRGAYHQHPRTAGRSSQLFNTGTVHWVLRSIIDGLFGLRGCKQGLRVEPKLPSHWNKATIRRRFRGAEFNVTIHRDETASAVSVSVDGHILADNIITDIESARSYDVEVRVP